MTTPASSDAHSKLKQLTPEGTSWQDVLAYITGGYWVDNKHWIRGGVSIVRPIFPESTTQPFITPRLSILHSNAGPAKSIWTKILAYWSRTDITGESTFQVDGVDAGFDNAKAVLVQQMPMNRRADCNAKANSWTHNGRTYGALSFETQDRGGATLDTTPWSGAQLHAIVGALTCASVVYDIACTEPAAWNGSGIGHHSRFSEWSIYQGKTCPGKARIAQMPFIRQMVANNLAAFAEATGWKCVGGL